MKNKHLIFIIYFLLINIWNLGAQSLEEICALDLPVMIINTVNNEIPTSEVAEHPEGAAGVGRINANKVPCSVTVRLHDSILYESGEFVEDKSGAKIRVRGNTTAKNLQKPYKLKLQKKADLLFRGDNDKYKDKEWALLYENNLRTLIGFTLNKIVDLPYKPEIRPINLFMNGEYGGLYYLVETIKRNEKCRINVDKETGYIFEYDLYWWTTDYYIPLEFNSTRLAFTMKYPDSEDITNSQKSYIEGWLKDMQLAVINGHAEDYLCLDTCARWLLARDLLGNADGEGSNLFFAKENNTPQTKAYTPALWDFDGVCKKTDVWSSLHIWEFAFFHYMFNYHKNNAFYEAYCKEWQNMQEKDVTGELIKALYDFANSDEASSFEKSHYYSCSKYNRKYLDWSLASQVKEYDDWFRARQLWIDNAIEEDYPVIMKRLKYGYIYPEVAYDILGRRTPSTRKGIKIIEGGKYMEKH